MSLGTIPKNLGVKSYLPLTVQLIKPLAVQKMSMGIRRIRMGTGVPTAS